MTLLIRHEDVLQSVTMTDAIAAMEAVTQEEADGHVTLPPRTNMTAGKGWLRIGPVALERSGWAGFKAMNLVPGVGLRYQVHLYRIETGEIAAIMDAQHLTTLRTGAMSAVATIRMARPGPAVVALLGAGVEARAQLEAMHAMGVVASARVFSPTPANRERLARDFRASHHIDVVAVDSAEAAVSGSDIVLAAVKSKQPVLDGGWLRPGMHVNSVGTARRDQRELDTACFTRAATIVVDTREGVFGEAGDAVAAREHISEATVFDIADLVGGRAPSRRNDDEITLFKSVGTSIQDIGLARVIFEHAKERGLGLDLGAFPYLKAT